MLNQTVNIIEKTLEQIKIVNDEVMRENTMLKEHLESKDIYVDI